VSPHTTARPAHAAAPPGADDDLAALLSRAPLAPGYRFAPLERDEIDAVIALVTRWFPEIGVGGASGFVERSFYEQRVRFADAPGADVLVLTLRQGDALVGVFACELERRAQAVHARIGVALPGHRGARLAQAGMAFSAALGRHLGMGIAYGMATLKAPHSQRAFEREGYTLVGITPGLDRERVAPGVVRRVYEAMYVKVLVDSDGLLQPSVHNMTPRTRAMFDMLFGAPAWPPVMPWPTPGAETPSPRARAAAHRCATATAATRRCRSGPR
jgi:hypothetical protein